MDQPRRNVQICHHFAADWHVQRVLVGRHAKLEIFGRARLFPHAVLRTVTDPGHRHHFNLGASLELQHRLGESPD